LAEVENLAANTDGHTQKLEDIHAQKLKALEAQVPHPQIFILKLKFIFYFRRYSKLPKNFSKQCPLDSGSEEEARESGPTSEAKAKK